jgi:glycosyltransferase involved in cell wall biosynthesis
LAEAALYIVPLRLGVGIRGKILEAWSMQRPVIATSLACSGLPVQHSKNAWIADSAEDFAAGIVCLLRDPELRKQLGEEGRCTVEKSFGWNIAASQLERVYFQALREAGRCRHDFNEIQCTTGFANAESGSAISTGAEG